MTEQRCQLSLHSKAYDRLLSLPYVGWAWEFKRRDPALQAAARQSKPQRVRRLERSDGVRIIRMTRRDDIAESFDLHFIPDPALSWFETPVFWLSHVLSDRFEASALPEGRPQGALNWDKIPGRKAFLITPHRRTKLQISASSYTAHLSIQDRRTPFPAERGLWLTLGADALLTRDLRSFITFSRLCRQQSVTPLPRRGAKPKALRNALIALDGAQAGLSQRRIALGVYNADHVREDWDHGPQSYKMKVRRLIRKGQSLMHKDYRKLL